MQVVGATPRSDSGLAGQAGVALPSSWIPAAVVTWRPEAARVGVPPMETGEVKVVLEAPHMQEPEKLVEDLKDGNDHTGEARPPSRCHGDPTALLRNLAVILRYIRTPSRGPMASGRAGCACMDKRSARGGTESETRDGGAVGMVLMRQRAWSPQIWELLLWGTWAAAPERQLGSPWGPLRNPR